MRALGVGSVDYALTLGVKVVVAGFAIAVVELMMSLIFNLGNMTASLWASLGSGLVIYIVAGWLYPGKTVFALGFSLGVGFLAFAGVAAGIHGVSAGDSLQPILVAFLPLALGSLVAGHIVEIIGQIIAWAFTSPPETPFTLSRLKRLKLLTDDERQQQKAIFRLYAKDFMAFIVVAPVSGCSAAIAAVQRAPSVIVALLLIVAIAASAFMIRIVLRFEKRESALRDQVLARLADEGRFSVATVNVTYAVGWELDGKFYPIEDPLTKS